GIWDDTKIDEVIWAVQNNSGDPGSPYPSADVMSFRFDRNTFGIHPSLIKLYDTTNDVNDVRFNTFYFVRDSTGASTYYALQKFKGKSGSSDNLVNFKVFRTSEMYLIRAEAYAQTNNTVAANEALSALKTARITGYVRVPLTRQLLLDEIQNERRRELAAEGHRWFDLKRTTRIVNRPTANIGNKNAQVKTSLPANSPKWAWPIPETETRANPNVSQNPGY
ncbi:MAG: RagB/SusD family nutrient uptake outer membrane protein, partial [Flavisolibacter sp.]|nr:RagB/SusD family nutrient uptake outer membrane protein [Flavisolibacter sp.]